MNTNQCWLFFDIQEDYCVTICWGCVNGQFIFELFEYLELVDFPLAYSFAPFGVEFSLLCEIKHRIYQSLNQSNFVPSDKELN